jgi:phosphocarrier protein HPr
MNGAPMQRRVIVANPQGLHLRPSAAFVELAGRFQTDITVTHNGTSVNGKSVWDLLLLAAEVGSELTLEADGPDAPAALDALSVLVSTPPVET